MAQITVHFEELKNVMTVRNAGDFCVVKPT